MYEEQEPQQADASESGDSRFVLIQEGTFKGGYNPYPPSTARPSSTPPGQGDTSPRKQPD